MGVRGGERGGEWKEEVRGGRSTSLKWSMSHLLPTITMGASELSEYHM